MELHEFGSGSPLEARIVVLETIQANTQQDLAEIKDLLRQALEVQQQRNVELERAVTEFKVRAEGYVTFRQLVVGCGLTLIGALGIIEGLFALIRFTEV